MNIQDAVITHRLSTDESKYLNDFLAIGWRIMEVMKFRHPDGEGFYDELAYLLGADRLLELPDSYKKMLEANRKRLVSGAF